MLAPARDYRALKKIGDTVYDRSLVTPTIWLTLDEQATNLPRQYGPWTGFKTIELKRIHPLCGCVECRS